jgi:hypothetical protein
VENYMDEARDLKGMLVRFKVRAETPRGDKREVGQLAVIVEQWPAYLQEEPVPARRIDVEWGQGHKEHSRGGCSWCGEIRSIVIDDVEVLGPPP